MFITTLKDVVTDPHSKYNVEYLSGCQQDFTLTCTKNIKSSKNGILITVACGKTIYLYLNTLTNKWFAWVFILK